MSDDRAALVYVDFKGGLSEAAPDDMNDNELIEARNTEPDERGSVSKCHGTRRVNAVSFGAAPIDKLIEYGKADGTKELLAFYGSTLRLWNVSKVAAEIGGGDNGRVMVMVYDPKVEYSVAVNAGVGEQRELSAVMVANQVVVNLATRGIELPRATIGNGSVIIDAKVNQNYTVAVNIAAGNDIDMTVSLTTLALVVSLGTDNTGAVDDSKNTPVLIAEAINGITGAPFIAGYVGSTPLTLAESVKNFRDGRAETSVGSGANGTVTIRVNEPGTNGNGYTVAVVLGVGSNRPLITELVGVAENPRNLVITLGTNRAGGLSSSKNTATRVAAAINKLPAFTATASGTGGTALTVAEAQKNFGSGANRLRDSANTAGLVASAVRECDPHVKGVASGTGAGFLVLTEAGKALTPVTGIIKSDLPGPPTDYDIYNDVLYWLDGKEFWQYDSAYIRPVTMHPSGEKDTWEEIRKCHFIEQRGQRHFFARKDTNVMYYSETGDPRHVAGNNFFKAVTDDSDLIIGLREYAGALLVFKQMAIFSWFGWNPAPIGGDVQFTKITVHRGAISQDTIQRVENTLIYMAHDDVFVLNNPFPEQISTVNISEQKISRIITGALLKTRACAGYYRNSYRLSISTSGVRNDVEYRYFPRLNAWYGPYDCPANDYLITMKNELYTASPEQGLIYQNEIGYNFDNKPIHFKIKTRPIDVLRGFANMLRLSRVYLAFRQYEAENSVNLITMKCGYQESAFVVGTDESLVWDSGDWGTAFWGWKDLIVKEIRTVLRGHRVQVTVENNNIDEPCTFYGFRVKVKAKKARGSRFGITEVAVFGSD